MATTSALGAPQTLLLSNPSPFSIRTPQSLVSFPLRRPSPKPLLRLRFRPISLSAASSPAPELSPLESSAPTRTLTALFALTLAVVRKLSAPIAAPAIALAPAAGSLFFAAVRDRSTSSLNTPLTVVAAGMAKWLDIYSGVLMVRVLLSWFPNIPWDRQPLSAIRDLCDPYLNLFRNIIPPVFDTLDVSPLLAFAVLGTLGSILSGSLG